jgi:3-deoxy-D-manno-octulosonic-acid transferase
MSNAYGTPSTPLGLAVYRTASRFSRPIAEIALRRRLRDGKEDPLRIDERRGVPGRRRPDGSIVWIHGASVGESLSVLPLVHRLKSLQPDVKFLVTTGTITSAKLMAERLPEGAFHQYIPLDHPDFVASFLDHWRPQAALFVESEFWPNLILAARERVEFMALINGRVSPKSFEEWSRKPHTIHYVLSAFDLILAQDTQNAERLKSLSGRDVLSFGNLKNAAPPLPAGADVLEKLRKEINGRPVWLAASTHPGEEEAVFSAHRTLKLSFPSLLTILAPRHPERGRAVRELGGSFDLKINLRSAGEPVEHDTDVYLADTLGELGLFYRLSDISFVGGSLTPKGGHNPLEPARLGGAILHGPYTFNFVETYSDMRAPGGAALVRNDRELATAIRRLLSDEKTRLAMSGAAQRAAEASAERVLNDIATLVAGRIDASACAA